MSVTLGAGGRLDRRTRILRGGLRASDAAPAPPPPPRRRPATGAPAPSRRVRRRRLRDEAQPLGKRLRRRLQRLGKPADRLLQHVVQQRPDEGLDPVQDRAETERRDALDGRLRRPTLHALADLLRRACRGSPGTPARASPTARSSRRTDRSRGPASTASGRAPSSRAIASSIASDSRISCAKCCVTTRSASAASDRTRGDPGAGRGRWSAARTAIRRTPRRRGR